MPYRDEAPRSALELRWQMFGVRFRVLPTFWVISAVFSFLLFSGLFGNNLTNQIIGVAIDVLSYFAALVFMELVQGLVYRSYGIRSTAVIQEFGVHIEPDATPPSRLQRITVALSGPASAWLLFAILYYSNPECGWRDTSIYTKVMYELLKVATFFWGIVGILPIYPYPGGLVLSEVFGVVSDRWGLVLTLVISILVALGYVAYTILYVLGHVSVVRLDERIWVPPSIIASVFFGLTVLGNWQLLQYLLARPRVHQAPADDYDDDRAPWER